MLLSNNYESTSSAHTNDDILNICHLHIGNIFSSVGKYQGKRASMEDISIIDKLGDDIIVFALFDGHSKFNKLNHKKMIDEILKIVSEFDQNLYGKMGFSQKLKLLFRKTDLSIYKANQHCRGGTTAILLLLTENYNIIINLGDSKAVHINSMANKIYIETIQHRPNLKSEYERIFNSDFKVTYNHGTYRINNELSLSRSIGDFKYKLTNEKYDGHLSSVSIEPNIYIYKSQTTINHHNYYILASDGFWDFVKTSKLISIIRHNEHKTLNKITELLTKEAIKNGSNDNITIIIINEHP